MDQSSARALIVVFLLVVIGAGAYFLRLHMAAPSNNRPVVETPSEPAPGSIPQNLPEPVPLSFDKEYAIPTFNGNVPNIFDDITFLEKENKFMVANSVGMGEFPLKDGNPVFDSPGFTAECPDCNMRGFVQTRTAPTTALVWAKRAISVSTSRRSTVNYNLPAEITDPSGISFADGNYLVADRASSTVFILFVKSPGSHIEISDKFPAAGKGLEGVAFDGTNIWTTDGANLFSYDSAHVVTGNWSLPEKISGFCFADGHIWAAGKDTPKIYRFPIPQNK